MDQKSHLRYRSLILAGVFIVFALAFLLLQYLHPGKKGAAAEISCSGQVTQVLDLSKNQEVTIPVSYTHLLPYNASLRL